MTMPALSYGGVVAVPHATSLSPREKLHIIEAEMLKQPQLQLHVEHYFSPGIYTRALHIPKGTLLTGKIHKQPILNIMTKGDISVLINDEVVRIKAPFVVVSPAGSKKIGYAHEDTIWMGCHATDETDVEKIEATFVTMSEKEFLEVTVNFTSKLGLTSCG